MNEPRASFDADWLRLREAADRAARDAAAPALQPAWHAALRGRLGTGEAPLRVVDLGCGTGAALRWLAPRLRGVQHWLLVDHDAALLQAVPKALAEWAQQQGHHLSGDLSAGATHIAGRDFEVAVECRSLDLALDQDRLPLAAADVVSASALLDLVSAAWLEGLVEHTRRGAAVLSLALIADGRIEWQPAIESDLRVAASFARHQQRDKGFGAPALGARAATEARQLLVRAGYEVAQARADWVLRGGALHEAFAGGVAAAAAEQEPADAAAVSAWRAQRVAVVGSAHLRVGHVELVAWRRRG